jgi:hypothetical protein
LSKVPSILNHFVGYLTLHHTGILSGGPASKRPFVSPGIRIFWRNI